MNTIGLIVGNRGFFPAELCVEERQRIIKVLKKEGFNVITLSIKKVLITVLLSHIKMQENVQNYLKNIKMR